MSTPSTSLDEDCLADAKSATRSRPLGPPTDFSEEDIDASRVYTDVDRLVSVDRANDVTQVCTILTGSPQMLVIGYRAQLHLEHNPLHLKLHTESNS